MRTLICILVVSTTTCATAQDFPNPKPTKAHKHLAKEVGSWDCDVKMFLQGPTGPATAYKGVEVNKLVSGNLFLQSRFTCQMGDRKFEGHSLMGYDSRSKTYVGTWVDNFTSSPTQMKGTYDTKAKTFTVHSKIFDEATGAEIPQKQVTTYLDDCTKQFEIFMVIKVADQTMDIKLMEMTAKKRK